MLEDRDYMRPRPREFAWSLTSVVLVANVVVFVVQWAAGFYLFGNRHPSPIDRLFALSIAGLREGYFWQPITFQFMHAGVFHLLANLITIYFFGRVVEECLGKVGFVKIYLGSGVFGGLLQLLASLVAPHHFGYAQVVGASAGGFGLVAAFATLYPERPITLLVFFVVPVSLRAKFLLYFAVGLAVLGIVVPMDNIAHVAHLGGILVGVAFVRWGAQSDWPILLQNRARLLQRQPRQLAPVPQGKSAWRVPSRGETDLPPSEFISQEVDPILDKISAHGIHSLTPQERRILEAASARMSKR
jgi:membrane associated rhomboid family serine protease